MKKQVNLYQPSCYPERPKGTFAQFLMVFVVCIVFSLASYFITRYQTDSLNAQLAAHKVEVTNQQLKLSVLAAELQKKRAPEEKIRQHRNLQRELDAKQRLVASIAGIDVQDLVSFSELMRGLSNANMADLSIKRFSMTEGILNISGNAKHSDSVPRWLSNVQVTKELSAVAFKALSINEEAGFFTFKLTNSDLKGKANE